MTLSQRDRRALMLLGTAAAGILVWWAVTPDAAVPVAGRVEPIPVAERRLRRLREISSLLPGKEQLLGQARTELAQREKGLLIAPTAAQAQAQLLQVLRRVGQAQQPPVEIKTTEIGPVRALGQDYAEMAVSITFETRIDTLLNFMADLSNQKELIATGELRLGEAHPKHKVMPVRLTVTGAAPRSLAPKKGPELL